MRVAGVAACGLVVLVTLGVSTGGDHATTVYVKEPSPDAAAAVDVDGQPAKADAIPTAYRTLVAAAGRQCKEFPPAVVAAQIDAESQWNPKAGSPAGAQGIAQFMPGTWASSGVDGDRDGKKDVWNPADAIPAQAKYMCGLISDVKGWLKAGRVKGDVLTLALAAYNAGGGAVLKHGGVPPYPETRDYVRKIPAIAKAKYTAPPAQATTGAVVVAGGWANPLPAGSYRLSSQFGRRSSPGGIGSTNHGGVDMAAPADTAILAAHSGKVTFAGPMSGYGNLISVSASSGGAKVETKYAHMYTVGVKKGQTVKAGQRLAGVGSAGNSTGNHLHFEVLVNGDRVDPVRFLMQRGVKL